MALTSGDHLRKFLRIWMKQNGLTMVAIEKMSGGDITDGYVFKILSGASKYPSVDKVQALAKGIAIDEGELFAVARGLRDTASSLKPSGEWNAIGVVNAMQQLLLDPDLSKIVQGALRLNKTARREVLQIIDRKQKPEAVTRGRGRRKNQARSTGKRTSD